MEAISYKKKIVFDGELILSVGASRKSMTWTLKELSWAELIRKLSQPTITPESFEEYQALPKAQRDEIKDVGGFVGGVLKGGRRKLEYVGWRSLLTLDLDNVTQDPWPAIEESQCACCLYSTHSHEPKKPRLRIVMPLARKVTADEYAALSRRIAADIGIDMCDDTTYEAHRLMYWPSCSSDADYRFQVQDAPWLDPDEQLARYVDWINPEEWPVSSRQDQQIRNMIRRQGDPLEKPGVVGAFCQTYSIHDAIDEFLSEEYIACANGRYTYVKGSTVGGLIVYDDKFAYSHHSSDPVSGKLCNAFDLVRLHQFRVLDADAEPGTPTVKLPSYMRMCELATSLEPVRAKLITFEEDEEQPEDWLSKLDFTGTGQIRSTIDNMVIILTNDAKLNGRYVYDTFRERPTVIGDLPWQAYRERNTRTWTDQDDSGLRWYFEKRYKLDSQRKLKDAIDKAMLERSKHPVREYLAALKWDGVLRLDSLLGKVFTCDCTDYVKAVTRKAFIGAVARIMEPGCKHDHMLVLIGPQGCGKSSFLARLGDPWFSDSLFTVVGKTAYEQLQGSWIIELSEMAATRKAELEQIKQFISKQVDTYRAAYGVRTNDHPRQCAFFGTTNDTEFLQDATGNRRFWPVEVTAGSGADYLTKAVVDQVWAEAVTAYNQGESWYLSRDLEKKARQQQLEHMEKSAKTGIVEKFLEKPVGVNWLEKNLDERRIFWADPTGPTERRTQVCALEIWVECFNGDPKMFTRREAREINGILRLLPNWKEQSRLNCGAIYGYQRGFEVIS